MVRRSLVILFVVAFCLTASVAGAGDTPHMLWVKAKCALCHGEDGSGNTEAGRSKKVRDLRSPEIQKMTDAELTSAIRAGHASMPGFGGQLTTQQVATLVTYIRGLAKPK